MRFYSQLAVLAFFILSCLACAVSNARADVFSPYTSYNRIKHENMETGTIEIKGELIFEGVFHRLGENWVTTPDKLGLNKYFNYMPSLKPDNKWEDTFGQTFLFNVGVKPVDWFFAELGLEFIGDYADRYWIPVNQEHRMELDNDRVDWNNARIGIIQDAWSLTYYKNYAHDGWVREGDMFDMLLKQDDPDNYLRYSGHHTPDYWQFKARGFFGDLDVIYGEEVMQDYKQGIYVKYKNIFNSNINFFYSDHIIPYGEDDERMRNFQLNTDFDIKGNTLQLGLFYRPFRLDWNYQYTDDVGSGNGVDGSRYIVKTDTTEQIDALGGSVKFTLPTIPKIDLVTIGYEYRGLVAGNRQRADISIEKKLSKEWNAYGAYYYQRPLLEAMPLVYSGAGAGPIAIQGRGPESPFWVWWRNPVSGFDNRETSAFSFVFTYDPTPSTWFYQFDANTPIEYNLNPEEDAPFSFAVKTDITRYYGTLDRQSYWEYDGSTVWEYAYAGGTSAPDRYIGSLYFLSQIIKGKTKIIYDFEVGEDLATLSYAYDKSEPFLTPMIGYFKTSLSVRNAPYFFKVGYNKNYWGPEDWHRNFGSTYDELYLAHASRDIGQNFNVGIEYAGARKTNPVIIEGIENKMTRNEMGYFDEVRVFFKVFFDMVLKFGKEDKLPFTVEHDMTPPQVALKTRPDTIYPDNNQKAVLEPWVHDPSGIDTWKITLRDPAGEIVKTFDGEKEPPAELDWDGRRIRDNQVLPDGPYYATLEAYDNYGNYAVSEPQTIRVMHAIANTDIQETERGLVISLGAKVLFDTAKYDLKPGAVKTLKEVSGLLKTYPDNYILIEGHTDWVGKVAYNQQLSENRANAVKKFLTKEGIEENRIKIVGHGKLKPIADNNTVKGREQNRRVEIIVLKDDGSNTMYEHHEQVKQ